MKKLLPLALIAVCLCSTEAAMAPQVGRAPLYDASGARVGIVVVRWQTTNDINYPWKLTARVVVRRVEPETTYLGRVAIYAGNCGCPLVGADFDFVLNTNKGGVGTANISTYLAFPPAIVGAFHCQLVSQATEATIASDLTPF